MMISEIDPTETTPVGPTPPIGAPDRRITPVRVGRAAEFVYAVALVALLTQGPVLSIWWRSTQAVAPSAPSTADQAIFITFIAAQVPALLLLARRGAGGTPRVVIGGLASLCGLLLLSTLWSTARIVTWPAAVAFTITSAVGVWFGSTFSPARQMAIILLGVQPGLVASRWAINHGWDGAIDTGRNWVGIYYNRNSLSPPAVLGVAAAVALAVSGLNRRGRWWPASVLALLTLAWWCLRFQLGARSATSLAALLAFLVSFAVWVIAARLFRDTNRHRLGGPLGVAHIVSLVGGALLLVAMNARVSRLLGRPAGFDGRTDYWAVDWTGIRIHPLRGWGWLAAWSSPEFRVHLPTPLATETWSHNAYLDLLLGAGVLVVLPFVATVVGGFWHLGRVALADRQASAAWPIALATLVLVAATQESFIIGNHILWLSFVGALAHRTATRRDGAPHPLPQESDA